MCTFTIYQPSDYSFVTGCKTPRQEFSLHLLGMKQQGLGSFQKLTNSVWWTSNRICYSMRVEILFFALGLATLLLKNRVAYSTCSACNFIQRPLCFFFSGGIKSSAPLSLKLFFCNSSHAMSALVFSINAFSLNRNKAVSCFDLTSSSCIYCFTISSVKRTKVSSSTKGEAAWSLACGINSDVISDVQGE